MQLVPDTGFLPVTQAAPTTYAAAAAHLARKQVPTQARLQDEEDAREHCTIVEGLAPWVTVAPLFRRGQQWFDECRRSSSSIGLAISFSSSKQ